MHTPPKSTIYIQFDRPLRKWDGFGFNYVETSQTRDYGLDPQEYGGFSLLGEADREKVLEMVFGEDGLQPGLLKMFLDPFHQAEPEIGKPAEGTIDLVNYDHETTTRWMRLFAREGLKKTRARGADLAAVVTLYGPPAWMTLQQVLRGRDLDPRFRKACACYMISWAKYLRDVEGLPVKYISLHNEGEDWVRWPEDGGDDQDHLRHDYNLYWSPAMVRDFIRLLPEMLSVEGMGDVGVTSGECTNWSRFHEWGYADAIADDPEVVKNLGLITSHGFYAPGWNRWHGDWRSTGIDILREKKPELHAWVTSTSWSKMDVEFINEMRNNIYMAKVNGIIPWAGIQVYGKWVGGDPNPGAAFKISREGNLEVQPGYYYYKQVCRAGQPGMSVVRVFSNEILLAPVAFSGEGTEHPDAFVILNLEEDESTVDVRVSGNQGDGFQAYRTSPEENYAQAGRYSLTDGILVYRAPARSVTTFYAQK